ncbi:MAG TPA: PIN domain protein [Thermoanaerobaculia bacterium]|nr:PIN domain protein [Thermoanaerobaculia bacterium]
MRIYVDTSVFGGYFDPEFEVPTRRLFEMFIRGAARMVLSELTIGELEDAPVHVRTLPALVPTQYVENIGASPAAEALAELYLQEGIMRPSMHVDALHIASAVVARVDVLVSWNFRDMVNLPKIRGYNTINSRVGYPVLDMRTPAEVIIYGN